MNEKQIETEFKKINQKLNLIVSLLDLIKNSEPEPETDRAYGCDNFNCDKRHVIFYDKAK